MNYLFAFEIKGKNPSFLYYFQIPEYLVYLPKHKRERISLFTRSNLNVHLNVNLNANPVLVGLCSLEKD